VQTIALQTANSTTHHNGTAPLPDFLTSGTTYYLGVIVDDTNVVTNELREDNNASSADSIVVQASQTILESFGSTSLTQVGNNYCLYAKGTTNGPEVKFQNAPVTTGMFGATWTPFAGEQAAGGYEVAWKNASTGQFVVWTLDGNGNYLSSP